MKKFKIKNKPKRKYVRHKAEMDYFSSSKSITMGVIPSILVALAFFATFIISSHPTADGSSVQFAPAAFADLWYRINGATYTMQAYALKSWQAMTSAFISTLPFLDPRPALQIAMNYLYILSERVSYALLVFDYTVTKAVIDTIYSMYGLLSAALITVGAFMLQILHWIQSLIAACINFTGQVFHAIGQFISRMIDLIETPFKIMGQGIDKSKPYLKILFDAFASSWMAFYTSASHVLTGHLLT